MATTTSIVAPNQLEIEDARQEGVSIDPEITQRLSEDAVILLVGDISNFEAYQLLESDTGITERWLGGSRVKTGDKVTVSLRTDESHDTTNLGWERIGGGVSQRESLSVQGPISNLATLFKAAPNLEEHIPSSRFRPNKATFKREVIKVTPENPSTQPTLEDTVTVEDSWYGGKRGGYDIKRINRTTLTLRNNMVSEAKIHDHELNF